MSEVVISTKIRLWILLAVTAVAAQAQAGYGGPQILSRRLSNVGDRPGADTGFQYYAGLGAGYEVGILPTSVDQQGHLLDTGGLFSIWANLGAYGRHSWRHTELGLDYSGYFRHYTTNSFYDNSDHVLSLQLTHRPTRRLKFEGTLNAGTISRYYVTGATPVTDILTPASYALFDNRAYYLEGNAGATYQMSARLSISASGQGFGVRHRSQFLIGLDGYGGQGVVAYRLNRKRTLDLSYRYTHIDYVRGFGESNMNLYLAGVSQMIGPHWQFNISGGTSHVTTIGLQTIPADPVTQALFGTTSTVEAFHRSIFVGAGQIALHGRYKSAELRASYSQLPAPGNGIYLTSSQRSFQANYRYIGFRKTSVGVFAGYSRIAGFGQEPLGQTWWANGGFDAAYKITRSLEAIARYDARNVQIDRATGFSRLGYIASFGVNWHPSEFPLAIW